MKIRNDFEGITIVRVGTRDVVLRAGDTVPEGVYVGVHLIETKVEPDEAAEDGSETNAESGEADEGSEAGDDNGASLEIPRSTGQVRALRHGGPTRSLLPLSVTSRSTFPRMRAARTLSRRSNPLASLWSSSCGRRSLSMT